MQQNVKEYFDRLVSLYSEINLLNEDIKEIKGNIKDMDLDATLIAKVAKAQADSKVQDLEESSKALLSLIAEVNNG
ncbi:MAG TPA: hypothetical protein PKL04_06950 [Methanofastidiosum sp.]|nr:hypothetical protein [Methanofastidiosum sp.]